MILFQLFCSNGITDCFKRRISARLIFKGGCQDEASNYRGIPLINILGKNYSQILLNRLNKWAEEIF